MYEGTKKMFKLSKHWNNYFRLTLQKKATSYKMTIKELQKREHKKINKTNESIARINAHKVTVDETINETQDQSKKIHTLSNIYLT